MVWGVGTGSSVPSFLPSNVVSASGLIVSFREFPVPLECSFIYNRSWPGHRKNLGMESKRPGFKSDSAACYVR